VEVRERRMIAFSFLTFSVQTSRSVKDPQISNRSHYLTVQPSSAYPGSSTLASEARCPLS